MKKHPVFFTFLLAAVILTAGTFTAYYNTKSLAVDGETVLFSRDADGITVMDYKIYYSEIEAALKSAKRYLPGKACSTAPYVVLPSDTAAYIMYIIYNK